MIIISFASLNLSVQGMNNKYQGSVQRKTPTSRFNYRVNIQRTPTEEPLDPFEHQQSAFTFEHSATRDRIKDFPLFDDQQEGRTQTIAKNLIQQNVLLKEQLRNSYQLMKELQIQLNSCKIQIKQLSRPKQTRDGIIDELKFEIEQILNKNKIVQKELNYLKTILPSSLEGTYHNQRAERIRSTSLDFKRISKPRQDIEVRDSRIENNKTEELMHSISNMHFKIMGFRYENMKQLWRWLKNMGYTYSQLKKCRSKLQDNLSSNQISKPRLLALIQQLIGTLDS